MVELGKRSNSLEKTSYFLHGVKAIVNHVFRGLMFPIPHFVQSIVGVHTHFSLGVWTDKLPADWEREIYCCSGRSSTDTSSFKQPTSPADDMRTDSATSVSNRSGCYVNIQKLKFKLNQPRDIIKTEKNVHAIFLKDLCKK